MNTTTTQQDKILECLSMLNKNALLLEPRETFDRCVVGLEWGAKDRWPREKKVIVAIYDASDCIQAIADDNGMDLEEAEEDFDFNVAGGMLGENTPTFRMFGDNEVI